jgi:membrane fusion protein (multidrug efflux system)
MRKKTAMAILCLAALTSCRKPEVRQAAAAAEPAPVNAQVIRIEPRPFSVTVPFTGTLVSSTLVDVKAEIIGRVVRFDKKEGDPVAAGEAVLQVDEENYKLALRQAESAVQVAEAGLERTRVMAAHNRSEMERARNLVASGGITDRDLKAADVAERDARAQVSLAEAQLDQARAAVEVARKRLRDCSVRAPVAGEIQKKYVNPGAYVEAPTQVFSIVDNRRLELESPVAASDLGPVRRGQRVTFTVNSYPGVSFEARVEEVNPALETDSRSARVRIQVANAGGKLKAGMFAQGEILTGVESQAIVLPSAALYRDDQSSKTSFVYAVDGGKAVRRPVRIGREREQSLEIVEGLKAGDVVVAEQSIEVAEGVRIHERK